MRLANTFGITLLGMWLAPGLKQPWATISERFQRYLLRVLTQGSINRLLHIGGEAVRSTGQNSAIVRLFLSMPRQAP